MKHSTKPQAVKKPHSDFPLYPHNRGYWAKKIRGKIHYFGKCADDPQGQKALSLWLEQKDDLLAGRVPQPKSDGLTVGDLANHFLTAKQNQHDAGELSIHTWNKYKRACDWLVKVFSAKRLVLDLRPTDFEKLRNQIAKGHGTYYVGDAVQCIRVAFKYAYDSSLLEHPIRFGPQFKRPSRKAFRMARAKQPPRLFAAADIRGMLEIASPQFKAMMLLAINCGFGNADCASLPIRAVDLKTGWIDYPRPKTGIDRRCPLWAETVQALEAVLEKRKEPKNAAISDLLFITKRGNSFAKETSDNPVSKEMAKIIKALNIQQKGRAFYSLRHTFRTIADESRDQPACDHIMGHASEHISSHYRERIDDARLLAVSNYVRGWLFGKEVASNG